ncbi:hypothetical protein [Vibrio sp. SCSIO 43136]|uniref:hypothetical protein n=1 Tax=Vibrio sp. SCSIO 43136 TaxID=2819101 RepID=UPI0020756BF7|nr:hypothetical protein [Vibrio sp. SCSIO 43136]USD67104.1 hypothetical protein J4N39_20940 [Vibrio sp. SCSIO 43136]
MKKTLITAAIALLSTQTFASDSSEVVVLSLKTMVGDQVVAKTELFSNQVDPNTSSIDDTFRLVVNGKTVDAPQELLADISRERRSYSYDSQSGGIENPQSQMMCMLGGEPVGYVLETRYLTFDDSSVIKGHEMKAVSAEAGNCLFKPNYQPANDNAQLSSVKALATLKTLAAVYAEK